MHTEIVAYYGGGVGSSWGGGGLALNPGAVSWEERRACCTLSVHAPKFPGIRILP